MNAHLARTRIVRALRLVLVSLAVGAPLAHAADTPEARLAAEIGRVQDRAQAVVPEQQRAGVMTRLERARAALGAGRFYLALFEFESAFESTHAYAFVTSAAHVDTAADFAREWKRVGEPAAAAQPAGPAILAALASSAEARAPATYRASLPYGQDANLAAGLYYLGESQALVAFARFVRGLSIPPAAPLPPLRSLTAELGSLDKEVTDAYERMTPAEHPTYVLTSVALKRARTLNDSGHYAGALLEYLQARLRFATLRPGVPAEPPDRQRLGSARARLDERSDHSIARMFLEMADAALTADDAATRRSAALILDDVLPAYHAALREAGREMTSAASVSPVVTITLVRWPFT